MSTARALEAIGRLVEVHELTIRRPGEGPGTLNEATLVVVPAASTVVYTGSGGIGGRRSGQRRDDAFADRREEVVMLRLDASEAGVDDVDIDDEVEFTDGRLLGQTWQVIGGMESSWRATKRFIIRRVVQEVSEA